jgi:hypothetical protein
MNSLNFSNFTIIIPTSGNIKFLNNINFNISNFIKLNIKVIIISSRKIEVVRNKLVKLFILKADAHEIKIYYGLKNVKTDYTAFVRDDEIIHIGGLKNIYQEIVLNKNIASCQGIKFIVNPYFNYKIYPHNPDSINHYNINFLKKNILERILNYFKWHPECYWTIQKTRIVKKYFELFIKKKKFLPLNIYDYYFILYLLVFGEVITVSYPWSVKIKMSKNKNSSFEEIYSNKIYHKEYIKNINYLSKLISKKRNLNMKVVKEKILQGMLLRLNSPKPRDFYKTYNIMQKIFSILIKISIRIKILFNSNNLLSQYDVYSSTKLNNLIYKKILDEEKITHEFNKILSFIKKE